jgi:hypothetical protein
MGKSKIAVHDKTWSGRGELSLSVIERGGLDCLWMLILGSTL